uniref:NADH-ubiquinone oxidoreductase chain 4 n=1 Tax=Cardiocephaloides medioconiger TaxID=1354361 RepID=A0A6J3YV84_9TREM|nr:NADH dehydrogenase subunit 4 [Cardiocephaloides medioconiger]
MKFKVIDWYSWFVGVLIFSSLIFLCFFGFSGSCFYMDLLSVGCLVNFSGPVFVFDLVGFTLSLLSIILLFVLFFFTNFVGSRSVVYILFSIATSILCYCSNHVFFFWWFYEVSILSLLFLLVVESPYSERYLAGWYLSGYVVLTSLPMLLCLIYFSCVSGSLYMSDWLFLEGYSTLDFIVFLLLGVLFITKIPIPPFHVWLPIVHAEATSIVSVCLSGYIMKLGLLGVCRFCWWVLPDYLFGFYYVCFSFFLSILFFLMASRELDSKRWLAFLSLSHIIVCAVCLSCCFYDSCGLMYFYSLGHGLSAGLIFIILWWGYGLCGSRNWMVIKSVLGGSLFFRVLICLGLCTAASLPPIIQFFVEVNLLLWVGFSSITLFFIFCFYLFFSSLIPLFFLGFLMSRQFCVSYVSFSGLISFSSCVTFLSIWCFFLFAFI